MRLSRIWRILQIKESVIHSGRRPRWITPSKICRILHILREPNSIIALLFNRFLFPVLKGVSPFRSLFFCSQKIRQSSTLFFLVNGSVIYSGAHFWRHRFNNLQRTALLTWLIQYDKDSFQLWWRAADYGELWVWFSPIRNREIF